ncbi:MAG: hypothetical protein ABJP48_06065 [Erythrobacter sp.]
MEIDPRLLQFGVSLAAILLLAGLAMLLRLGPQPSLVDKTHTRAVANEVLDGFEIQHLSISENGDAALLRSRDEAIMVIKTHGTKFAGRILSADASAYVQSGILHVDCGEVRFGTVSLKLADAADWANAIHALKAPAHD